MINFKYFLLSALVSLALGLLLYRFIEMEFFDLVDFLINIEAADEWDRRIFALAFIWWLGISFLISDVLSFCNPLDFKD